jgi:hypothetical protein
MESAEFEAMYALATKRGKDLEALERKNARRRAKGLPRLLSDSEKADLAVHRRKHKTMDPTTVTGEEALKLFKMRKAKMEDDKMEDDVVDSVGADFPAQSAAPAAKTAKPAEESKDVERAIREAEAVRRVEDLKNGRINHAGVWSDGGNKLEGGDQTRLPDTPEKQAEVQEATQPVADMPKRKKSGKGVSRSELDEFKNDLYGRLKVSFEELEKSISDLQGRVSEIVTASTPAKQSEDAEDVDTILGRLLEGRTTITFDVHGTKMTCDAVKVFYNSPCITILSKIGSATIQPEAGARLKLSYEAEGRKYVDDPVTFVGLRVDLEELGFSLVGFVRDVETDLVEVQ